jgi:hypothetical protein
MAIDTFGVAEMHLVGAVGAGIAAHRAIPLGWIDVGSDAGPDGLSFSRPVKPFPGERFAEETVPALDQS